MAYVAKRRRGPNKPKAPQATGQDSATAVIPAAAAPAEAPTRRRKRADVNGQHLKLKIPEREGYQRRWVNDVPGRIAMFHDLAYDVVTDPRIKSDSTDSSVRRLVGTQAGGAPQYAVLMETPLEEFRAGIEEKEESHRGFEEAIRRGEDTLAAGKLVSGHGSIS